jgi:hypothetical protein
MSTPVPSWDDAEWKPMVLKAGPVDPPAKECRAVGYLEELRWDAWGGYDRTLWAFADHECEHGHLPHDRSIKCDCWPVTLVALRERVRGLSRTKAIEALLAS